MYTRCSDSLGKVSSSDRRVGNGLDTSERSDVIRLECAGVYAGHVDCDCTLRSSRLDARLRSQVRDVHLRRHRVLDLVYSCVLGEIHGESAASTESGIDKLKNRKRAMVLDICLRGR